MKHRKTQLAAAVGAALLLGAGAVQAQNLQVQLYGQANRALMFADNETQSKWFFVDNQMSSTRFGIQGTSQVSPGLRAGARIETEIRSNQSNSVTFATPATGTQSFTERWLEVFFEGGWGRINLGQGSGAADDASGIDLSGTSVVGGATLADLGGGIPFTGTGAGTATPSLVIDNFDFESRYDRVMYTTPVFGGFRVQAGLGQKAASSSQAAGEVKEASIWYSGRLAGELQAAIGWSNANTTGGAAGADFGGGIAAQDRETIGGSVSWLSAAGFNITGMYTQREMDVAVARDASHWMLKLGYKFGTHAIAAAWAKGEDQLANGDEADAFNISYVWNPIRWAEVYAGYTLFQLDRSAGSPNDITVFTVGSRIRF